MSKLSKIILKEKIDNFEQYYKQYPNAKRVEAIEKINQRLDNQEYKIAVVANMSSGKSTFINALFGGEVLPAFNHATTDCATFIYSKPNIDKKAIIYFNDKKKPIKITDNIEEEIKQYAQKDAECEDYKHKNVEKIELYYPFKNLQTSLSEDFSITFIDTPGPNSTGDDYKQKHKDQTRNVLNDVDLALFMFDYTQLDANLSSDEQGLWNTIKTRHKKDKNFDVYFLLNKIDMAIKKDNFQEIGKREGEEYKKFKLENWFKHEALAIKKLSMAGNKHGIKEPKIYPIASELQLFSRDKNIGYDAEDKLELFQKQNFIRVFDNWEEKFIEYLGIHKLEQDINTYINSSVKDKILVKVNSQLNGIHDDENKDLELRLQTLQKPQEEAEENLKKADIFLHDRAKKLQNEMKKESVKLENKYIDVLETIVNNAIAEELISNIDKMTKETIAFTQAYALDTKVSLAMKKSKKNASLINLDSDIVEIEINKAIDKQDVMVELQKFMQTIFEDYKRNYLDLKSDLKEEYFYFKIEVDEFVTKYKKELDQELENSLEISMDSLQTQSIDYSSMLTLDLKVPNSVLDYSFEEAKYKIESDSSWWNPFSWGRTKKVKESDKKYSFIISPSELRNSIEKSMEDSIYKFSSEEKKIHTETIKSYLTNNFDMFQNFRHDKVNEINKLKKELEFMEENLEKVQNQYSEFNKLKKDR